MSDFDLPGMRAMHFQQMQPIEREVTADHMVASFMAEFDLHNETVQCEFNHTQSECSFTVTHVVTTCIEQQMVCANSMTGFWKVVNFQNAACRGCKRPIADCWKARAV